MEMYKFISKKNIMIKKEKITFSKNDLNSIIQIYSQKVSNGIWKDYSINFENVSCFNLKLGFNTNLILFLSKYFFFTK